MWPQLARSCCWAAGLFGWLCPKSATLAQTRPKLIVLHTISTSERELFDVATPTFQISTPGQDTREDRHANPNPSERPLLWANVQKE
jgi:hypothetical protein